MIGYTCNPKKEAVYPGHSVKMDTEAQTEAEHGHSPTTAQPLPHTPTLKIHVTKWLTSNHLRVISYAIIALLLMIVLVDYRGVTHLLVGVVATVSAVVEWVFGVVTGMFSGLAGLVVS